MFIAKCWKMDYLRLKIGLTFLISCSVVSGLAQNIPFSTFYTLQVERYVSEQPESHQPIHLSIKPFRVSALNTDFDRMVQDTGKFYNGVTEKLFKKNLIDIRHKKFRAVADPLIDFRAGKENPDTASRIMFQNTRGVRIAGSIGEKFSFETRFYENQARFPDYFESYVRSRGEKFPKQNGSGYRTTNAVIPGEGRTKPFKIDGFDYASAMGYITGRPTKFWTLSFGHDMHFIGNGYRSLLLSDNSFYGPFVRSDLSFFKDRLRITNIYQGLQNLYRLKEFNTPESTYEKKWGTFHYLDYAVTPWLSLGLFEGIVWNRSDSLGTKPFPYQSLIPVPFVNTAVYGLDNQHNAVLGLNMQLIPVRKFIVYGQFMLDDLKQKKYGFQLGLKYFDAFQIRNLFIGMEYNNITRGTYAQDNPRNSYSHFNLPLAHPYGSGFQEVIVQSRYHYYRVFAHYKMNVYLTNNADTNGVATNDIFNVQNQIAPGEKATVINHKLELGYRFNKANNFQFYMGFLHRLTAIKNSAKPETFYFFVGIRTKFKNFYDDI